MPRRALLLAAALAAAAISPRAIAASAFDGVWISDPSETKIVEPPQTYLLKDGAFTCSACQPPYVISADGQFHSIASDGYRDGAKIVVIDPHTTRLTYSFGGKEIGGNIITISPEGSTLSNSYERTNLASGKTFSGHGIARRVAPAPAGAHLLSGSWQYESADQMSQNAMTTIIRVAGDMVTMTVGTGETYTAKFGGPAVAQGDDPGHTLVSVTRPSANTIVEQDSRQGNVTDLVTYAMLPDGKSMKIVDQDKRYGGTTTIVAHRQ